MPAHDDKSIGIGITDFGGYHISGKTLKRGVELLKSEAVISPGGEFGRYPIPGRPE
jgi:hypothetical protein